MPLRLAIGFAILVTAPAGAQVVMMEAGPEQARLNFLQGDWVVHATMHMPTGDHTIENPTVIEWLPGGVWLLQRTNMPNTPIGAMHGIAQYGWDQHNGQYVRHWTDNQSTVVLTTRGDFVNDSTLVLTGSFEWVDGRVFHERMEIVRTSEGWTETGFLGTDPNNLPMNHRAEARRKPAD